MQIFAKRLPLLFSLVLMLGMEPIPLVQAATFTVNSVTDAVDAMPGDGVCATADGVCTLRAAVQEANALAGADTIALPAGLYVLSIAGTRENAAATGDLDIADDLSIIGASAANTIIDAGKVDRIFDIFAPASTTIAKVTIENGDLEFQGAFGEHGGGIRNMGTLALNVGSVAFPSAYSTISQIH